MKTIFTKKDILNTSTQSKDWRWVCAKPEWITLWWRIRASIQVLKWKALPLEWE